MRHDVKPVAAIVLTSTAVFLWWLRFEAPDPQREIILNDLRSSTTALESVATSEVDYGFPEPGRKWSGSGITSEHRKSRARTRKESEESQVRERSVPVGALDQVQNALTGGGLKAAYRAYQAIQRCNWMPETNEEWQSHIDSLERHRNNPEVPTRALAVMERSLERSMARREECQELRSYASATFFGQLFQRASNGDPVARFLYAMWPPVEPESYYLESEALLAYYVVALDFTLANLQDGHPLGFLAFGLSHQGNGYFSPNGALRGIPYFIAAELCSGDEFQLQELIDAGLRFLEAGHSPKYPSADQVMEAGIGLHEAYCATGMDDTAR